MIETEDQNRVTDNIAKTCAILIAGSIVLSMALALTAFFWILKMVGE